MADELNPALVLMDINMPEMNGIEATRRIVSSHPEVVVVLCSTYEVGDLPPDAATSGARAYINKEHLGADTLRRLWDGTGLGSVRFRLRQCPRAGDTGVRRSDQRNGAGDPGALSGLRFPANRAPDGAQAIGHVDVAVPALRLLHVEPRTIVAH